MPTVECETPLVLLLLVLNAKQKLDKRIIDLSTTTHVRFSCSEIKPLLSAESI